MKDDNCIFCKIANGEIPSTTLYEDDTFRVIFDLNPATKGHCLILPKEHYENLTVLPDETAAKVLPLAGKIGKAMEEALGAKGFKEESIYEPYPFGEDEGNYHTHAFVNSDESRCLSISYYELDPDAHQYCAFYSYF